ncbi:MAG: hypothetical protein AAFZ80_03755 [Cyanobacteria bacterium P01_A01_bin.105]
MPKSRPSISSRLNASPALKRFLPAMGRFLRGPYGVAAIASISFHGVVFALGSTLSGVSIASFGEGADDATDATVPLVELSAAEQGRLPDFSARRTFTGRVPVPSTTPPSLPIQRTPQRSRVGTAQRSTGLRQSSPSLLNRPRTTPRPRATPRSRSNPYAWNDSTRIARIPLPPNLAGQGLPVPPDRRPAESPAESSSESTSPGTTSNQAAGNTGANGTGLPTLPNSTPGEGSELSLEGLQNPQSVDENEQASGEQATGDIPDEPGEGSGVEAPEDDQDPEELASNDPDPEQIRLNQLRDSLKWDATGTEAGATEVSAWMANLQRGDETIVAAEATQGIDANIRVCVENPPTNAIVGVLVQPDGAIADTTLIKRTGYDVTDQAALNAAAAAVAPGEQPTAYQVNVSVGYEADTCVNPGDVLE